VLGSGWPKPDPLSSVPGRLIKILMDLDQSNAPGALAWSGSIRSVGLGFLPAGFWFSFNFLSFSCYVHPWVCYLDLLCVLTSLQNPKKNCYAFLIYLWLFCDILHAKIDKIWQMLISHLIGIFCVFYKLSCTIMDPTFALWCWYLIYDFCDVFISEFMLFLHSCMPNC